MELCVAQYLMKVNESILDLQEKHAEHFQENLLFAYRGENKDFGDTKLMPSIFRTKEYVDKESHLFELLCDYNMVSDSATNVDKAIEAQHYIAISRMLDISFSVLTALYFACEAINEDDDRADANLYVFAFPKHYSPHSKYIQDFYTDFLERKHIHYSRNFKVFSHSYSNNRIKVQKGGFVFFPGVDFCPINQCYYKTIKILSKDKKQIREELDLLFQINLVSIYPEKQNVANAVKERFRRNSYDLQVTTLRNEVDTYFERLKYELMLDNKLPKEILRILRKEENDLMMYIKMYKAEKVDVRNICEEVATTFSFLRLKYKEV